jgi:hypothetical protein
MYIDLSKFLYPGLLLRSEGHWIFFGHSVYVESLRPFYNLGTHVGDSNSRFRVVSDLCNGFMKYKRFILNLILPAVPWWLDLVVPSSPPEIGVNGQWDRIPLAKCRVIVFLIISQQNFKFILSWFGAKMWTIISNGHFTFWNISNSQLSRI